MGKRKRRGFYDDLSDRALIARNCGARFADTGDDEDLVALRVHQDPAVYLTADERAAYSTLLPATWWASFRTGYRERTAERHARR